MQYDEHYRVEDLGNAHPGEDPDWEEFDTFEDAETFMNVRVDHTARIGSAYSHRVVRVQRLVMATTSGAAKWQGMQ